MYTHILKTVQSLIHERIKKTMLVIPEIIPSNAIFQLLALKQQCTLHQSHWQIAYKDHERHWRIWSKIWTCCTRRSKGEKIDTAYFSRYWTVRQWFHINSWSWIDHSKYTINSRETSQVRDTIKLASSFRKKIFPLLSILKNTCVHTHTHTHTHTLTNSTHTHR